MRIIAGLALLACLAGCADKAADEANQSASDSAAAVPDTTVVAP